jgi:hypothetical protein
MEAVCFSEMLIATYKITQCHNREDHILIFSVHDSH